MDGPAERPSGNSDNRICIAVAILAAAVLLAVQGYEAAVAVVVVSGAAVATVLALRAVLRRGGPRLAEARTPSAGEPFRADHFVATEFAAAQRGRAVTVVIFGFDAFDAFTAAHGPAVAEAAVREFGRILAQLTRRMNYSARYGWRPDAFLSVLSEANVASAIVYVRRVQAAAAEASRTTPLPGLSIGVAEYHSGFATPVAFVGAAEQALAAARADGGGGIRCWDPSIATGARTAVAARADGEDGSCYPIEQARRRTAGSDRREVPWRRPASRQGSRPESSLPDDGTV